MMYGSQFYNVWAALFSFTGYFIWAIQDPFVLPWPTIGIALIVGITGYLLMFIVRYFIGYVFYTPVSIAFSGTAEHNGNGKANNENENHFASQVGRSTAEQEEDTNEEIANVVRTMLHGENEAVSK
jgi:hypothetical protein